VSNRRIDFFVAGGGVDLSLPIEILSGEIAAQFDRTQLQVLDIAARDAGEAKATVAAAGSAVTAQDVGVITPQRVVTSEPSTAPSTVGFRRAELHALVTVIFNGVKYLAGLDTGASHSMIDKSFAERHAIPYTLAMGSVELADSALTTKRIGFVDPPLRVTFEPPGITLSHAFEIFNVRASTFQYDFLIGRDLQERLFRQGNSLVLPLAPSAAAAPWPAAAPPNHAP
jgi:hypothetical protein